MTSAGEGVQQPVGWRLSAAELVAISDIVTSNVGYPEVDHWWARLGEDERRTVYRDGLEELGTRGEDAALRDALRVRRDAVGVLLVEPSAGSVLVANIGRDDAVVMERVTTELGLDLLPLGLADAAETIVGALAAGLGGSITILPLPQPAPVAEVSVVPSEAGWRWTGADFEAALTPEEVGGAVMLLARDFAAPRPTR